MISVLKSSFNQDPKGHLFSLRDAFPIQSYCIIIKLCESFVVQIIYFVLLTILKFVLIYMEIQYRRKNSTYGHRKCVKIVSNHLLFFFGRDLCMINEDFQA